MEGTHRSGFSFLEACQNKRLCCFQRGDGVLPTDSRVLLQEFIQRFSAFQVIKQRLERDARAAENRFPAVNFRILDNYAVRNSSHGGPPARIPIISSIRKNRSEKCKSPGMQLTLNPHHLTIAVVPASVLGRSSHNNT